MNRIEELIKEKGYTFTSFADKLGTTKQNLYGKLKSPSYPTLVDIAKALEVPMWQLFASEEEVMKEPVGNRIKCPDCGHEFRVKLEVEKT